MSTRAALADRSVIVTGISESVDVEDFINTLVQNAGGKKPVAVHILMNAERRTLQYVVHLQPKMDKQKLLNGNSFEYKGKSYTTFFQVCPEEDIPPAWLTDPPDFTPVLQHQSETMSDSNTNVDHQDTHPETENSRASGNESPRSRNTDTNHTSTDNEQAESCTIEVRGFRRETSDETFEMYFENIVSSDEQTVINIVRKNDVIFVTFSTPEEAMEILRKTHTIEEHRLRVTLHIHKACYKNMVLVSNLKNTTAKESLKNYLEARSRCDVVAIVYGEHPGTALATFHDESLPVLHKLRQSCKEVSLGDRCLVLSTVPKSDTILVKGIGGRTTEDTISFYFGGKRSGNDTKSEVNVTMQKDYGLCFVQFKDRKALDRVLSKTEHRIDDIVVSVSLFIESLGIGRTEDDQPWYQQPEAFTMKFLDKHIFMFLRESGEEENLKKELAACNAEITWPSDDTAALKCSLTDETPDAVQKAKTWRADTEVSFKKFLDHFKIENVTCLSQIWPDVCPKLKAINTSNTRAVMYITNTSPTVVIVGKIADVPQLVKEVKAVVGAVEHEFNRKEKEVTETITSLKSIKLRLLSILGVHTEMMKAHKDLVVTIDLALNKITFKGQVKDILSCTLQMYERIDSFCSKEDTELSAAQLMFMDRKEVRNTIMHEMNKSNLFAEWETQTPAMLILSTSEEAVQAVAKLIRKVVVEHIEVLTPQSTSLLRSKEWSQFQEKLQTTSENLVFVRSNLESNSVTVVAIHRIALQIRAQIQDFIAQNSIYKSVIITPIPILRFLMMHRHGDIKSIEKRTDVKLEYKEDKPQIIVHGSKKGQEEIVKSLTKLSNIVFSRKYTMQSPGIGKYIHYEKIQGAIAETEKSNRCVISLEYDESESVRVKESSSGTLPDSVVHYGSDPSGVSRVVSCSPGSGRQIDVCEGDITTMKVDVIVNAANERLDHQGGLALIISEKGGQDIQTESNQYIAKHKNVPAGNAVPAGPGRLPCKMVVHAVGPYWKDGQHDEELNLKTAVMNSMDCADKKGFRSIALPALSAGLFGYPIEKATKHIVEAVKTFLKSPNSGLTNVYLVDVNEKCVKHFGLALKDVYSEEITFSNNVTDTPMRSPALEIHKSKHRDSSGEESEMFLQGSLNITLVKGEIANQITEAIVNSTSKDLDLAKGATSKSILETGGPSLQSELKNKYPSGIEYGDIAVSTGGNLMCQEVYHICLPNWDQVESKQLLKNLVRTCLNKASERGFTSIAFPALGTGNLGYPKDDVAQTMFTAVREFQQIHSSLEKVLFVVYRDDGETIKAFEKCEKLVNGGETLQPSGLNKETDFEGTSLADIPTFSVGNSFTVNLVKGEINKQKADVIVNSVARNLDLNSGTVAKCILKSGGDELQTQLRTKYPDGLGPGEIASTTGGDLQCKEVYHICLPSWSEKPNQQFLNDRIQNCLRMASDAGYESIVFPALGTGNLGYPKDVIAKTMYAAMANFQRRNNALKEVTIVIYPKDTAVFQEFDACDKQRSSVGSLVLPDLSSDHSQRYFLENTECGIRLHLGSISFTIKQGDITTETTDGIVNSTNKDLDLRRGMVSRAIASKCGTDMEDQCSKKKAEMNKNGVVSTTATGLQCKYVIHVAGKHFRNNWKSVIMACLYEAEKHGDIQSLAFPVLGTGVGKVTPKEIAAIMVEAMDQFQPEVVNVRDIRVVVFQGEMVDTFTTQIKESASRLRTRGRANATAAAAVDLYFFSDDKKLIDKGILKLEDKCGKELKTRDLKESGIMKLTDEQIQRVKEKCDVLVDKRNEVITITGLAADVGNALLEVTNFLRNIDKIEAEDEKADLLSRSVQWMYLEGGNSITDFDPKQNLIIEKKFKTKEKDCKVKLPKGNLKIDFKIMKGTFTGKNETLNIIRRDISQEAKRFNEPKTWQLMDDAINLLKVTLPSTDQEYVDVLRSFRLTIQHSTAKVVEVIRIQNRALYQQYTARKKQLEKHNPPGTKNERRLWHGTSYDTIDSINIHGYNRSYCGRNATSYGQGVYFAVEANYSASDTFSKPHNGYKYMYLARVLTGIYEKGHLNMRTPPPKPSNTDPLDLCDSVVDNVTTPRMFVVFNDAQAYPEYLVTFQV